MFIHTYIYLVELVNYNEKENEKQTNKPNKTIGKAQTLSRLSFSKYMSCEE